MYIFNSTLLFLDINTLSLDKRLSMRHNVAVKTGLLLISLQKSLTGLTYIYLIKKFHLKQYFSLRTHTCSKTTLTAAQNSLLKKLWFFAQILFQFKVNNKGTGAMSMNVRSGAFIPFTPTRYPSWLDSTSVL